MSQLNGCQLLEAVGGVDDTLIDESLDFFFPVAEARTVIIPPARPKRRLTFWLPMAAAVSAAVLCIVVTILPLAGGMNLWQGLGNFFLTPFAPGESQTQDSEPVTEPGSEDEAEEPEDETRKDFDPDDDFNGGVIQHPNTVPTPSVPTAPDPSPNLPGFNWDYNIPNTPPGPTYTPGPGPVRNPNLGG